MKKGVSYDIMNTLHKILKGETNMTNEEIMAVVKPAICAKLKSPSSAQFPVDVISIVGDEQRGYHIEGYVDSQNGYGAMIRNDFTADVRIVGGFPTVTTSSVGAKAAVANAKSFGISYIGVLIVTAIGGALLYLLINLLVG